MGLQVCDSQLLVPRLWRRKQPWYRRVSWAGQFQPVVSASSRCMTWRFGTGNYRGSRNWALRH